MKVDIIFTYEFETSRTLHARSISTDTGWKISLDRGLISSKDGVGVASLGWH